MSINVTVSGNPVSIKRGKLITTDTDYSRDDFDKRRRLRLEQVRNQSKQIAENVRNKVRKEKNKQLFDFEKQEEEKHKKWQNRKLLELQEQYTESLKDIGLGHAQAVVENNDDALEEEYREKFRKKAEERGEIAKQKLQSEKNKQNIKKAIPIQQKKITRDIENVRSTMVSKSKGTPYKKRKKKATANINITTNTVSDTLSESEREYPDLLNISNSDYDSSLGEQESGARRKRTKSRSPSPSTSMDVSDISSTKYNCQSAKHVSKPHLPKQNKIKPGLPQEIKSSQTVPDVEPAPHYSLDTRISDRIRNRRFLLNPNSHVPEPYNKEIENKCVEENVSFTHTSVKPVNTIPSSLTENCRNCKNTYDKRVDRDLEYKTSWKCCNDAKNELPVKQTVSLKNLVKTNKAPEKERNDNKVQYYDHNNRFSKEYISDKSVVHKISEESIEICPSTCSENEFLEKIYKQDRDAQIRGQKAMEKVNIHKDYKEMLKQLPVLQRQERLASISTNKPLYHMSDDRRKQYEKRKQNQMEDMYEKHFPRTITIPPKIHTYEEAPFLTIDPSETAPLKLAHWDVESKPTENGFTLTKEAGVVTIEPDTSCGNKENYLKYLLERLKVQKEMLLREVASLPKNSNLNNIIDGLETLNNPDNCSEDKKTEVSAMELSISSGIQTRIEKSKEIGDKKLPKQKRARQPALSVSNSSTSSTPPKKIKYKKYKLILQNTSTQTSPKINLEKNDDKENTRENSLPAEQTKGKSQIKIPLPKTKTRSISSAKSDSSKKKVTRSTSTNKTAEKDQATSPIQIDQFQTSSSDNVCREHGDMTIAKTELCEILIKIKDNEDAEVQVKSPKQRKDIVVKNLTNENYKRPLTKDSSSGDVTHKTIRTVRIDDKEIKENKLANSWKEQLSRNDTVGTSTSTSYYSPPEFLKPDLPLKPGIQNSTAFNLPTKDSDRKTKFDSNLLDYIKKLLTMSRPSVEDLGVSTTSDVSTPADSLLGNMRDSPLNHLRNIIKYLNMNPEEMAHYLNYSEDSEKTASSLVHNNTSAGSTIYSSGYERNKSRVTNISNSISDPSKTQGSKDNSFESKINSLNSNLSGQQNNQITPREHCFSTPVEEYGKLAEMCQKRISDLSIMIEKVRMEKQQILSPEQSDKENSTQYLKLPSQLNGKSPNLDNEVSTSSSDIEQAEINRQMLHIDYDFAEKLKNMTPQEIIRHNTVDEVDNELLERYKRLLNVNEVPEQKTEKNIKVSQKTTSIESSNLTRLSSPESIQFVPIFSDIPRLPKLTHFQENESNAPNSQFGKYKKPPPSKGLTVANKFNDNVAHMPHELSTIVEVDSQLSTRLRPSLSPRSTKDSPTKIFEVFKPVVVLPEFPTDWVEKEHKEDDKKVSEGSVPDLVAEITNNEEQGNFQQTLTIEQPPPITLDVEPLALNKKSLKTNVQTYTVYVPTEQNSDSSTDKSEMENIEKMLKSMGMGWAIATLRKTQATLTKSSSTSSVEVVSKLQLSDNSSSSDVTLRDILGKKIFSNSESASLSQSASPNFMKILSELSVIQGSGPSSETKHHRTSTPVQTTKSSESKKGIFTGESEVSSVKLAEDPYLTMKDSTGNVTEYGE